MSIKKISLLVIDDDSDVLTALRLLLKAEVGKLITEKNPETVPSLLAGHQFDVILLDMNFNASVNTGNEGLYWLKRIRELQPGAAVMMITAYADVNLAVTALKNGASDFIIKPWHNEKIVEAIRDVIKKRLHSAKAASVNTDKLQIDLVGESEPVKDILLTISKVAPTDASILILGENGTGKDLIAKAIHQQSSRSGRPFVKVDVGALSESLFESELFGHTKGSFTDAKESRKGRIESANGGTLFLDEIGNISLQQQARLLTVIQNRYITPVGSNQNIEIDIRLICATNLPLTELSNEQRFRKDLIYRINTVEIIIPPLHKREGDIKLLANHYLKIYESKYFRNNLKLDATAIRKLENYKFPGNVRELQYILERAVIMSNTNLLEADDIIFSPVEASTDSFQSSSDSNLRNIEKSTILRVIEKHNGNISKAARELGLTRTALYRRLNKYEI